MKIYNILKYSILTLCLISTACSDFAELTPDRGNLDNQDFVLPASPPLSDGDRLVIQEQAAALEQIIAEKQNLDEDEQDM